MAKYTPSFGAVVYKNGKESVNGGEIAYRLYSKGAPGSAPIVLICGWGTVLNDWFALPQELAKLGRTVLLFDNRCIGESSDHGGSVTVENMAADVLELAKALLPAGPFVAVGHSAGAFVAQHLAVHSPESVAACILVGSQGARKTAVNGDAEFFKLARKTYQDREVLQTLGQTTAGSGAGNPVTLADREKLLAYFITTNKKDPVNRPYRQICQRSLSENRPQPTILAQLKMLAALDYGPHLSSIRCPVLVLHGKDDAVIPPSNGESLFNELSGSTLRRLKVAPGRHSPFGPSLADGRAVAKEINAFLIDSERMQSKL